MISSRVFRLRLRSGLGLAVIASLAACSGSGGGPDGGGGGPQTDAFVGTWTYTAGTITPSMCMVVGQAIPPIALTGQSLTITKTDANHISIDGGTGCVVAFTVTGYTATAASGQTCVVTVSGIAVALNVTSWTLTVSGSSLGSMQSGSAPLGGASCTASGIGTLTKSGGVD